MKLQKKLGKYALTFLLVVVSVFAATLINTVEFTNNTPSTTFNAALYNCGNDYRCRNPTEQITMDVQGTEVTFQRSTYEYYAEYFFREGYIPQAWRIPRGYQGTYTVTFEKMPLCKAGILNVQNNGNNIQEGSTITLIQGNNLNLNTQINSAFSKVDNTYTPIYEPTEFEDWYSSEILYHIYVYNIIGNLVYQDTQSDSIYRDQSEIVNNIISTSNLLGQYHVVIETEVTDDICEISDNQEFDFYLVIQDNDVTYECSDGIDNDGDGDIDAQDAGCYTNGIYNPYDDDETNNGDTECSDGIDNDGDGLIDWSDDPGCINPQDDDEDNGITYECSDNIDNDGDGFIDENDPGCYTNGIYNPLDDDETNIITTYECSDSIDNDGDGDIDAQDAGCYTNGIYNPYDDDETNNGDTECSDGIDNDGDGLIDWSDDPGCINPQDDDEEDGLQNPDLQFTTDHITVCRNNPYTFGSNLYHIIDDGNIVFYLWSFGDGHTGSGATPTHTYTSLGNYILTLTVTDNDDLQDSDTLVGVNVIDCAQPYVNIIVNKQEGCMPLKVDFSALVLGDSPFSYAWDFDNDGVTDSTLTSPEHEFTNSGEYLVRLRVTDSDGDIGQDTITIDVNKCGHDDCEGNCGSITKEHRLEIAEIITNEPIYNNQKLSVNLELKNSGDYTEKNVKVKVYIEELGLETLVEGLELSPGSSKWKQVEISLPENVQPEDYILQVKLYNEDSSDLKHKDINVEDNQFVTVKAYKDTTEQEQNVIFKILEIAVLSLIILLLVVIVAIIIYKILE